jgi:hypothetical protein
MSNLTLTFEYDGPVHGAWSALSAEIDGREVMILPEVVGVAMGIEVHRLAGEDIVTLAE